MELRQLKYLVGIVEAGSVSRASRTLHVAQPALSQQINHLEQELGVQLLIRSVRGVQPTLAGLAVLQHARAVLKQVEATQSIAMQAEGGPAGRVTVGLPWTITIQLGLDLLREVRRKLPAVHLELTEATSSTLSRALAAGQLDLAVLFDPGAGGGLALEPVLIEPIMLIGSHGALAGHDRTSLRAAAEFPLVLLSRPNSIREAAEACWSSAAVTPNVVAEINAPGLLLQAVAEGMGFSLLPLCAIGSAVRGGDLDAISLTDESMVRTVQLGWSRLFPPSLAALAVMSLLKELMLAAVDEGRWAATPVRTVAD